MKPYSLKSGEGRTFNYGIDHTIKAGELNPGRGAAFFEYTTVKGEEPSDHTHGTEDQVFYVLSGKVAFHCDGETYQVSEGGFMYLPRGLEHGYTILSDEPAHVLVATFPTREAEGKGWGGYLADVETQGEPRA